MPIEAPGPVWPVTKPTEIGACCARTIEGAATEAESAAPPRRIVRREIICLFIVATSCWATTQSMGALLLIVEIIAVAGRPQHSRRFFLASSWPGLSFT